MPSDYDNVAATKYKIARAERRMYWDRNSLSTCVVLFVCVAVSTFVQPLTWKLTVPSILAGLCMYASVVAESPRPSVLRQILNTLLFFSSLGLMWVAALIGHPVSQEMGMVQIGGVFGVVVLGAKVLDVRLRSAPCT